MPLPAGLIVHRNDASVPAALGQDIANFRYMRNDLSLGLRDAIRRGGRPSGC